MCACRGDLAADPYTQAPGQSDSSSTAQDGLFQPSPLAGNLFSAQAQPLGPNPQLTTQAMSTILAQPQLVAQTIPSIPTQPQLQAQGVTATCMLQPPQPACGQPPEYPMQALQPPPHALQFPPYALQLPPHALPAIQDTASHPTSPFVCQPTTAMCPTSPAAQMQHAQAPLLINHAPDRQNVQSAMLLNHADSSTGWEPNSWDVPRGPDSRQYNSTPRAAGENNTPRAGAAGGAGVQGAAACPAASCTGGRSEGAWGGGAGDGGIGGGGAGNGGIGGGGAAICPVTLSAGCQPRARAPFAPGTKVVGGEKAGQSECVQPAPSASSSAISTPCVSARNKGVEECGAGGWLLRRGAWRAKLPPLPRERSLRSLHNGVQDQWEDPSGTGEGGRLLLWGWLVILVSTNRLYNGAQDQGKDTSGTGERGCPWPDKKLALMA